VEGNDEHEGICRNGNPQRGSVAEDGGLAALARDFKRVQARRERRDFARAIHVDAAGKIHGGRLCRATVLILLRRNCYQGEASPLAAATPPHRDIIF